MRQTLLGRRVVGRKWPRIGLGVVGRKWPRIGLGWVVVMFVVCLV